MARVFATILVLLAGFALSTVEPDLEAWRRLDIDPAQAIRQDLCRCRLDNGGRAATLNFIVVNGPGGWVISDVESPHDSLRMFLAQHGSRDH